MTVASSRERFLAVLNFWITQQAKTAATRLELLLRLDLPNVNIVPPYLEGLPTNPVTSSSPTITMAFSLPRASIVLAQLHIPP
jgi:hypothetical protein